MKGDVIYWVVSFLLFACVNGQLTFGDKKCRQNKCKLLEYCSEIDFTCQPCSRICDPSHHNFEKEECVRSCQDYLHEERFLKNQNYSSDLTYTVHRLETTVNVCLALIVILILAFIGLLILFGYHYKKNHNFTLKSLKDLLLCKKSQNSQNQHENKKTEIKKPDLRLDIPAVGTISDHSPVTMTTNISRRPAEDSAPSYAYDNPAMKTNTSDGKSYNSSF